MIAVLPGVAFSLAEHDLVIRLSYVNFDGAAAILAASSPSSYLHKPIDLPFSSAPSLLKVSNFSLFGLSSVNLF